MLQPVALLGVGRRGLLLGALGHGNFAAWEEPELFARQVRAAFGSLR